ncbi:MAG: acyl transferase [Cyclobacteriaceae bacterium]
MIDPENFIKSLFSLRQEDFQEAALELFHFQWSTNATYRQFCDHLGRTPKNVKRLTDIPFLPIELFKSQKVVCGNWEPEKIYLSSGTTQKSRSKHFIKNNQHYLDLARYTFEERFGPLNDLTIVALLPSYLEQGDSSLIAMIDHFIKHARPGSGYFLNQEHEIASVLKDPQNGTVCLFGVTYALLDLAETLETQLPNTFIIETGGMKGRRQEITREDLHQILNQKLAPTQIHSEYGMTELTSQGYSKGTNFTFPNWAQALIRDINDPFTYVESPKTGGLNIIDLGNVHTCAFIETRDLGKITEKEDFMVLGRYDNSDIRGCNLLVN